MIEKIKKERHKLLDEANQAAFVGFLYAGSAADTLFDLCVEKGIEVPQLVLEWRKLYKDAGAAIKVAGEGVKKLRAQS